MDIEKRLREKIRSQGKADSTADAYWYWVDRYLKYCKKKGIGKETRAEKAVEAFLSMLANVEDVSANTQNQSFAALCYLYRDVFDRPLVNVSSLRAKRPDRVREVLDQSEILRLFDELKGPALLCARMMYASSFRVGELGKLRIKDISFERKQITIRGAKGEKDRLVGFPEVLHEAVQRQIDSMRVLWKNDVAEGMNGVSLPKAFGRKSPNSHLSFAWYYLLSADNYSKCPVSGRMLRHHRDMGNIARQIKEASERTGIEKRITSHNLRHSFATHSVEQGVPIHVLQRLLGHSSIETTQTYLHASKDGATAAKSPLETLLANPRSLAKKSQEPEQKPIILRVFAG